MVFINSASMSYAEVGVDGNVHLIGTQGAGKSTLLRAILFFYNADKTKLGIPREKKGFDEYYFPYQNSYIVFEVAKENASFCVLAFKNQAKTCFRFIDSAYQKTLFIDALNHARDWAGIRDALGSKIGYSKVINSYEEYRNIIYGNNKGLSSDFKKYAMLESAQYQNIPRTIQNVFLNSKLEAAFIKATIIKSINEEELSIDLDTYDKGHLRDFDLELNDVKKWKKLDKAGANLLEKQARAVIDARITYKAEQQAKKKLAASLGWVLHKNTQQKPMLAQHMRGATQAQQKLEQTIGTTKEKFDAGKSRTKNRQAVIDDKLDTAAKQQAHYKEQNIEQIIARVGNKGAQLAEQKQWQAERDILTSKFQEIETQYEALMALQKSKQEALKNNQGKKQNELNAQFLKAQNELNAKYERLIEEVRQQGQQMMDDAQYMLNAQREQVKEWEVKKIKIENTQFFAEELALQQKELEGLQKEQANAQQTISDSEATINDLRKEWGWEKEKVESKAKNETDDIKRKQQPLEAEKERVEAKVAGVAGSLYDWLEENKPGWQANIGKVINEDWVLFAQDLEPQLINEDSQSVYGIKLDLGKIDKQVKSVEDYAQALKKNEQARQTLAAKANQCAKTLQDNINRLRKKYQTEIKNAEKLITQNTHILAQATQKIKAAEVAIHELAQKAANAKAVATQEAEEKESKAKAAAQEIVQRLSELKQTQKNNIARKQEAKAQELAEMTQQKASKQEQLQAAFEQSNALISEAMAKINAEKNQRLESEGANVKKIGAIDKQLKKIAQELDFIDAHQAKVTEYEKDKRELFDKVEGWQEERQRLDEKLWQQTAQYEQALAKLKEDLAEAKQRVAQLRQEQDLVAKDEEEYEAFKKGRVCTEEVLAQIASFNNDDASHKRGTELMRLINAKHYEARDLLEGLSRAVHDFISHFDEKNVFSFRVRFAPQEDEALLNFAVDLEEFINENKIATYEKRINDRFANIITQIGKEVGELTAKAGEISKIIGKINNDFADNKIFVKAIKHIEMKVIESDHKIMRTMVEIKDFNEEKGATLGAPNLFSGDHAQQDNQKAINLLTRLVKELNQSKSDQLKLSDSFDLRFKIIENDNDSGWVQKLANVGSEGTDILAKAMINITLLNVFKESASRRFKDFKLHCMMDEIGKLHPNNVAGILKFANQRNILLINGSPTSYNAIDYKYTYLLSKDERNITSVKTLVQKY
ncbi:conserved hypothetical protein [Microscilla marina ATCC 23134]|uniref:ATP-binding protein n=1 Tax=Microscilla marina ATCC 23134 TaxID=313606 RepID=A1ZRT4_MICM2|nr:conserved hypothetical protein [Microscilla marina ATCC 23134]